MLKSIHVKNFRSIKNETLNCNNLTALVGANSSGKSSFLRAIELFHSKSPQINEKDYYDRNTTNDIVIAVTFKDLSESAKKLFSKYITSNELKVERILTWKDGKLSSSKFYGFSLRNPDFTNAMKGTAKETREAYQKLKLNKKYKEFPQYSSQKDIIKFLEEWEIQHPHECERIKDEGQFFGFKEVAQGYLGKFVKILFVPAVRDADQDAQEGNKSSLTELMDRVIRNNLNKNDEFKTIYENIHKKYTEIKKIPRLAKEVEELQKRLTNTLQNFAPNTSIDLEWNFNELDIKLPAIIRLSEDGYYAEVTNTGHGLQRAFIMTMLQHQSNEQTNEGKETTQASNDDPTLILMIEEPELYQHPNRQRHLANILDSLAEGETPGVFRKTQVIYSTHSPHFVSIDRIDQIRLLRKIPYNKNPKVTKIFNTNLRDITNKLSSTQRKMTVDNLKSSLQNIMTSHVNEGFFSDVIVLVEGEEDRAYIIGVAESLGYKLEARGISVIPCSGKFSLSKPATIFEKLNIPLYIIWDGDKGNMKSEKESRYLFSLLNKDIEKCTVITDTFTCFETKMKEVVKNEIGEESFEKYMKECKDNMKVSKDIEKNP